MKKRWQDTAAYLELLKFDGVPWAKHYYAHINFNGERHDLYREITTREAADLNKADNAMLGGLLHWAPRDQSSRYLDEDHAVREALKQWREMCPDARVLIQGDYCVAQPQLVLDGLGEVVTGAANYLFNKCEELGWWDEGNEDEVKRLDEKWHRLIRVTLEDLDAD